MRHNMRDLTHMGHGEWAKGNRGSTRGRVRRHGRTLGHHGALWHEDGEPGADGRGTRGDRAMAQSA
eukprot:scaffold88741_cov38-Tisochrysis_lutea.AAC.2